MATETERLVPKILEFECNASVLRDAINLGSDEILFLPHENFLLCTSLGGSYTCYKLMDSNCFFEYNLDAEVKDEYFDKKLTNDLYSFVFSRAPLELLLKRIQGRVKISVEKPDPTGKSKREIFISDTTGGEELFSGSVALKERELSIERELARFVEFFDSEEIMIPKPAFRGDFHILKIKEGMKFNPIVTEKDYEQLVLSIISKNADELEIYTYNTTTDARLESYYLYNFLQSSNEDKLMSQKDHRNTSYHFPLNPAGLDSAMKYQSAPPTHIVIIENLTNIYAPYFVFLAGVKDMGTAGKIYTSSLLFLEVDAKEINEVSVDILDEIDE